MLSSGAGSSSEAGLGHNNLEEGLPGRQDHEVAFPKEAQHGEVGEGIRDATL